MSLYPYLLLLVSGGHCQILVVKGVSDYERLGTTIDDAASEAFDKVAKMLNLGYPGGPMIEKWRKSATKTVLSCRIHSKGRETATLSFFGLENGCAQNYRSLMDEGGNIEHVILS